MAFGAGEGILKKRHPAPIRNASRNPMATLIIIAPLCRFKGYFPEPTARPSANPQSRGQAFTDPVSNTNAFAASSMLVPRARAASWLVWTYSCSKWSNGMLEPSRRARMRVCRSGFILSCYGRDLQDNVVSIQAIQVGVMSNQANKRETQLPQLRGRNL